MNANRFSRQASGGSFRSTDVEKAREKEWRAMNGGREPPCWNPSLLTEMTFSIHTWDRHEALGPANILYHAEITDDSPYGILSEQEMGGYEGVIVENKHFVTFTWRGCEIKRARDLGADENYIDAGVMACYRLGLPWSGAEPESILHTHN